MTHLIFQFENNTTLQVNSHTNSVSYENNEYPTFGFALQMNDSLAHLWQKEINHFYNLYHTNDLTESNDDDEKFVEFENFLFLGQWTLDIHEHIDFSLESSLHFDDGVMLKINNQSFNLYQDSNGQWSISHQRNHSDTSFESYDLAAFCLALYWIRHYLNKINFTHFENLVDMFRPSTYLHYTLPTWTEQEHNSRQKEFMFYEEYSLEWLTIPTFEFNQECNLHF